MSKRIWNWSKTEKWEGLLHMLNAPRLCCFTLLTVYLGDSIGYYPCCSTCISLLLSPSPCWIYICFVQFRTIHRPIFVPVCERVQVPRVCTMASGTSNKCDERMTEASRDSFKFSSNLSLEEMWDNVPVGASWLATLSLIFFHAADELCRRGLQRRETGRSTTRHGTWC